MELKDQFESKLTHARSAFAQTGITGGHIRCFADRTEGSAVEINIGQAEICVIEDIEELRTELQSDVFRELRGFRERHVHDLKVWPNDRVASGVAEQSVGRAR